MRILKDLELCISPSEAAAPDVCGEAASFDSGRRGTSGREKKPARSAHLDDANDLTL